jgi:hypothetical protein
VRTSVGPGSCLTSLLPTLARRVRWGVGMVVPFGNGRPP